jgi:hypothetical protein
MGMVLNEILLQFLACYLFSLSKKTVQSFHCALRCRKFYTPLERRGEADITNVQYKLYIPAK